jgi:DNA-directed RNA polymerase subunit RPC12/RpoP
MDLKEYKCLNCNGAIKFDATLQEMKCPFCDSTFEVEAFLEFSQDLEQEASLTESIEWAEHEDIPWDEGEEEAMSLYSCNSCGGEIIADSTTVASKCPYCRNPVVMKGKLSGSLKPDCIIPFQLDKAAAKAALAQHLSGKKLLPRCFKSKKTLDEINGVYVPFWLFDAEINANMRYRATKVRMWADSRFTYTETRHFSVVRQGDMAFDNVPVDASTKIPSALMESIEPFDSGAALPFKTGFLAGYMADKFDYESDECKSRANERIRKSAESSFKRTVSGYNTVLPEYNGVYLKQSTVKYALVPVWLMTATWRDKTYLFAMNGQSGKFVGDLPTDWGIFWRWFAILTVIIAALLNAILLIGGALS